MEITAFSDDILRLQIKEKDPLKPRYQVQDVLMDSLSQVKFSSLTQNLPITHEHKLTLNENTNVVIDTVSLRFDINYKGKTVLQANSRGLFYFEQIRDQNSNINIPGIDMSTAWEQSFGGDTDRRPNGPESVGLDISFVGFENVYGIPEHATEFNLQSTTGSNAHYSEPYRLYNFDIFEYELDTPMALYGGVPFMMAHSAEQSVGIFWLNAAETWIDVEKKSGNVASELFNFFGRKEGNIPVVDTHWMSESGIIDVFFFVGPTPQDVFRQFTSLVGRQELPPLFSVAYHQCRWNYQDDEDVRTVNSKFEEHDIPYDVIWLDIEHTDGKRYFTWDYKTFPNPEKLIDHISGYGRKMVTIVDPHIKRDSGFGVHNEATSLGHYVKDSDGRTDYDGHCWCGSSSWVDYTSPAARDWWADLFKYEKYRGSTSDLYTWNDMNEPSVFNGPEVTMRKTAKHYGGWEHRDVHNIYGMLMQRATAEGLVKRNKDQNKRAFVLGRAFYAGTQRWGAIWTGDNKADWGHMVASVPMLLSLGVGGISFSGADVGGFFGNPEPELLVRWYQLGAFQPFFRGHAHMDTKRREPWVFGEPWTSLIRNAIITRYNYLPYVYTLFYESSLAGIPVMRPLWLQFPKDRKTFTVENSYLLGSALLVTPVSAAGQRTTSVYLPKGEEDTVWYDLANGGRKYNSNVVATVETPLEKISVFQRGGSIIPKKFRLRRSSSQMKHDPITLVVALDSKQNAEGELYIDDGDSFNWKNGEFVHVAYKYDTQGSTSTLKSVPIHITNNSRLLTQSVIERIVILGAGPATSCVVTCEEGEESQSLQTYFANEELVVKKPSCHVATSWTIQIKF